MVSRFAGTFHKPVAKYRCIRTQTVIGMCYTFRNSSTETNRPRNHRKTQTISLVAGASAVAFSSYVLLGRKLEAKEQISKDLQSVTHIQGPANMNDLKLTIFQYHTCPFCRKVRAFFDFYGFSYDVVEVNPVLRKEIKFSPYRKVPIVTAKNGDINAENVQLNDSSLIVSALHSYMIGENKQLTEILTYFPEMTSENAKGKKVKEYTNKYEIMLGQPQQNMASRKEEKEWRSWVDSVFVHTLSPNVYRTPSEAVKAFDYISETGKFSTVEKYIAKYVGAAAMYFISKLLKRKWNLKDDVRQSLYEEADKWMQAVGPDRDFMGGDLPNLADLAMYGVLSAIEGFDAFNDLLDNTSIKPWYKKTKQAVASHAGAN
uniref:Prostaglandin E synthase 2-like n=1 Tax=Saccoglossus kowalevskii TaxID=10224 RepID=A0ABM0MMQ4_SACKO|nr:PREDICTED: prostaglandin E synthase 2-like [Saccoglossus kowalevskii]